MAFVEDSSAEKILFNRNFNFKKKKMKKIQNKKKTM